MTTTLAVQVGNRQGEGVIREVTSERTLVVVIGDLRVHQVLLVALNIDNVENISAAVVTAERREIIVSNGGSRNRVVIVVIRITSVALPFVHITEDTSPNLVGTSVAAGTSEGNDEELTVVVLSVSDIRVDEVTDPASSSLKVSVSTVVIKIRTDELPLRESVLLDIVLERGQSSEVVVTAGLLHDGVESNEGVLSTAVAGITASGVLPTSEGSEGLILSVLGPKDAVGLQRLNEGRDVRGNADEALLSQTESVTTDHSQVVGLRVTLNGVVVIKKYTLACKILQIRVVNGIVVVGVVENNVPDLIDETTLGNMVILRILCLNSSGSSRVEGTSGNNGRELTRISHGRTCKQEQCRIQKHLYYLFSTNQ